MPSKERYEFNSGDFRFQTPTSPVLKILVIVLRLVVISLALSLGLYLVFALVWDTDKEARLRNENKMYEKLYPKLLEQKDLLEGSLDVLEAKDNAIYADVFKSQAPTVDPIANLDIMSVSDSVSWNKIFAYTRKKSMNLCADARKVEDNFRTIFSALSEPDFVLPPMTLPIQGMSIAQVGAGMGQKRNPFYKAVVFHTGQDFIAPTGETVYAAADGTVSMVQKSSTGLGNMVEIKHSGDYVTRYAHLSNIRVRVGQKVSRLDKIGTVGMSGSAYAPHLHFEIMHGGEYMDPLGYIFASVDSEDYSNMLYISRNSEQSLD